jgi:cytochrome c oxidase cbb3-type subunit III
MWSRWLETLVVLNTVFLFAAMPRRANGQLKADLPGAQQYTAYCAACHGTDGKGGDKAVSLATSQSLLTRSDSELFQIIHDGTTGGMPPFAQIGMANITALVHYLRALEGEPGPEGSPASAPVTGDVKAGRVLYFGKAQCSTCHMFRGQGGFIASNLTAYARHRTTDAIVRDITTPDNPLVPSSRLVSVTTRTGRKLTGLLRNEDNFNLELQTEDGRYRFFARSDLKEVRYTEHSLMPRDYGSRLTPKELDDIASFLVVAGRDPQSGEEPAP